MFKLEQLAVSTVLILTGCVSLAPEYEHSALAVPQQFSLSRNSLVPASAGYQDTGWKNFFVDPQTRRLTAEVLRC